MLSLLAVGGLAGGYAANSDVIPTSRIFDYAIHLSVETICDPYFVAFVIIPAWLLFVLQSDPFAASSLSRLGSYSAATRKASGRAVVIMVGGFTVLITSWVSFALANTFFTGPTSGGPRIYPAAQIFQLNGLPVQVGFVLQVLLLALTLLTVQVAVLALQVRTQSRTLSSIFCSVFWIWAVVSAAGWIPATSLLSAGPYLNVLVLLATPGLIPVSLAAMTLAVAASSIRIFLCDRKAQIYRSRPDWIALTFGALVALAVFLTVGESLSVHTPLFTSLSSLLLGPRGTVLQSLSWMLFFFGYTYLRQLALNDERDGLLLIRLIRRGSIKSALGTAAFEEWVRVILYLGAAGAWAILAFFIQGRSVAGNSVEDLTALSYFYLVNGSLLILMLLTVTNAAVWLTNRAEAGLIAIGALTLIASVSSASLTFFASVESVRDYTSPWAFNVACSLVLLASTATVVAISWCAANRWNLVFR